MAERSRQTARMEVLTGRDISYISCRFPHFFSFSDLTGAALLVQAQVMV